jgi:hypothetical protein
MNLRSILIVLATAPAAVASLAQTPAAQPQTQPAQAQPSAAAATSAGQGMPSIPPHGCVQPVYPGKNAIPSKVREFNEVNKVYGECIRKYVDSVRAVSNNAIQSGNDAITEYNKFAEELKKQIEADQ